MSAKDQVKVVDDTQWAGTEQSFGAYLQMMKLDEERMQAGVAYGRHDGQQQQLPYLLAISGNVGIVTIKGPMTNRVGYYDEYDKRASYTAIREALVTAANHADVQSILLDIDSGGGAVAGIADVGTLIRAIHTQVKPVTAFSDGNMFSAAYWLGASAGEVYATKVAGVGSIGVIATHMEMSKMLADMGINVTVMRAGKYKALANGMEPLTDAAKEQMQAGLDATYGVFVQHVADMRNVSYQKADSTMAQGREFYGEKALDAGLIDGITTFDALMSKLSVDKRQSISHNPQNVSTGHTMKTALTEQGIAALAAGVPLPTLSATVTEPPKGEDEKKDEQDAGTDKPEGEGDKPDNSGEKQDLPATQSVGADANVVTFLQAQIKDKDAALLTTNIELNAAKAKLTDYEASMSGLLTIAAKSANNMRIALGGSALDMTKMSAAQVLAEHESVSTQFASKFVVGGVAAVDAAAPKAPAAKQPDAVARARIEAAKPSVRK